MAEHIFQALDKNNNYFNYIELYVQPGDIDNLTPNLAKRIARNEIIIHAPHMGNNFDPSAPCDPEKQSNHDKLKDAFIAAELFKSKQIVLHGGIYYGADSLSKNIDFINELPEQQKKLIAIENLPYFSDSDSVIKRRYAISSPEEVEKVINATGVQLCLDFSHAVCTAISSGLDPIEQIDKYLKLEPDMFHICDGLMNVDKDLHLHLGVGDFPLKDFLKATHGKPVSLETGKSRPRDCYAQIQDAKKARTLYNL
ncbi:sugar phosphate isomerase/epimerase family protein [Photobacterium leiognathi]|uniref:sugar phosphate isomerase/epimerase family protein n=1 Tax=Photobacterium leiognathi TaxID=553611 RepID=UPI001EDE9D9D|nr:sugar phosphate isomerase/epimerase family protein [Photobacterium leiognathi]